MDNIENNIVDDAISDPLDGLNILVVEDDPNILAQLSFHLKSVGYSIDTATDGDIAIQKIEDGQQYDLMVLDIMMPRVSGIEVCRTIRQKYNLYELPILISSALSESQDVVAGLETGANDYITKPFQRIELLARVKNLLSLKYMTDIARANEQLANTRALYDNLTGLPNRNYLYNKLQEAIVEANRHDSIIATLFLNIDRFKSINNSLGHGAGDIYLRELAKRLLKVADHGDIVTRLYTDTFAVVKMGLEKNSSANKYLSKFAEKILDAVNTPIIINQYELKRTASIGIVKYPDETRTVDEILRYADSAMYYAKAQGNNSYIYYSSEVHQNESDKFDLERKLKLALKNKEFVLHYQPQISLADESIVGVEALIRWDHPEDGIISPTKFISVAEETGIIIPLGQWVLETASRQNKKWQEMGFAPIRVGVNLAPQHFHEPGLVSQVEDVLKRTNLSPEYLELEITEGTIMSNAERAINTLNQLRGMGIGLSIDDFGTGYSSLNYLKRFPIQTLKIDQSFISRDLDINQQESAIVSSIIKLGHSLKLNVIAEGVETESQLDYLRQNYCNEIQGFYYSQAVTADELTELLRNRSVR
ncbi:MAG: EAL domain-containing protein [Candidatus Marinimicrobia bacterium]|nr:EAL domain-containing protein [Candidatus Neomarinimicrobiota bacterium]